MIVATTTVLRTRASTMMVLAAVPVLAGCSANPPEHRGPAVTAETAKQKMIDAVDTVTGRLGGTWTPRTGPDYAESCELETGDEGANWVYLTGRADGGDPEPDAAATRHLWKSQGMTVERWADPDGPAIVGRGGDSVDSISLYAFPGNYTVQAVSLCFRGDADRL